MKKLFSTPLDKLYSVATIIVLLMIIYPPVYAHNEYGSTFKGYDFVFDLYRRRLIDLGRLSLQFIALGAVIITIKRMIKKT